MPTLIIENIGNDHTMTTGEMYKFLHTMMPGRSISQQSNTDFTIHCADHVHRVTFERTLVPTIMKVVVKEESTRDELPKGLQEFFDALRGHKASDADVEKANIEKDVDDIMSLLNSNPWEAANSNTNAQSKVTDFDVLTHHLEKVGIQVSTEGFQRFLSWPKVSQLANDNVADSGMSELLPFTLDEDGILEILVESSLAGDLHMHLENYTYVQAVTRIAVYLSTIYFEASVGNKLANM